MSKFPFYKQLDGMDCGPTCLRMIAKYYGKTFSVQQLREQSYIQRTGVNLLGISEAAASIGLRATGIRTSMDKLKQQSKLPCIIHWNQEHFVVLYKIEKKKGKTWFYIADPAYGLLKYEEQELKKCWISTTQGGIEKGIAMLLDVTPQFYEAEPIKYEKLSLWYLFHYVRPYKKAMMQLVIGLLAGSLLQLVFPFLTQTIVDQGIGHRNLNFIQLILAAQLMLVFSRTLIEVIRRCILLHISTRVNVSLISDFLSKLMRLAKQKKLLNIYSATLKPGCWVNMFLMPLRHGLKENNGIFQQKAVCMVVSSPRACSVSVPLDLSRLF